MGIKELRIELEPLEREVEGLVAREWLKLSGSKPNHYLLRHLECVTSEGFRISADTWTRHQFFDEYAGDTMARTFLNYFEMLRRAVSVGDVPSEPELELFYKTSRLQGRIDEIVDCELDAKYGPA